jgi:hypothetical protein
MRQLLAYIGYFNIVGENMESIKKNAEALLDANKQVDLEVSPEKSKYMLIKFP